MYRLASTLPRQVVTHQSYGIQYEYHVLYEYFRYKKVAEYTLVPNIWE